MNSNIPDYDKRFTQLRSDLSKSTIWEDLRSLLEETKDKKLSTENALARPQYVRLIQEYDKWKQSTHSG